MNNQTSASDAARKDPSIPAGVVAGLVGGLVATWAMSEFQALWSQAAESFESPSAAGRHDARDWQERNEGGTNANEIAAQVVATHTVDRPLTRRELAVAAAMMHYAFGAAVGAMYGGVAETSDAARALGGAGLGTVVWLGADEIAMPVLGLSDPDEHYPIEAHAQSFAAHLVFGVTAELVRRGVRALI